GEDQVIRIRDTASGAEVVNLQGHAAVVLAVAFGREGQRLASASADKTGKGWDTRTGQLLITLGDHRGRGAGVAVSPGRWRLASVCHDWAVRVWDAAPVTAEEVDQREALALLEYLFRKPLTPAEALGRLEADPTIRPAVRQCARDLAERYGQ